MILSNSRTLIEDIEVAKSKGFTEEFIFKKGQLVGRNNERTYNQAACTLVEHCIHEGMSDPSDQSILFLIKCTDGIKGCLSSSYGIYADTDLIDFVMNLKKENNTT